MKTMKFRTRILASFFVVIIVFVFSVAVLGFYVVKKDIIERAQAKVTNDLSMAREIYQQEVQKIRDAVRFTSVRFFVKDGTAGGDRETLSEQLEAIRKAEFLDILTLTDEYGKVIVRSRNSGVFGDSQLVDRLVGMVLSDKKTVAGTVIVSKDELAKEGQRLVEQAYIKLVPTVRAKPDADTEQTSGMMIKAASPILGRDGELIGVLYGGSLLNRNYRIVDKIKNTVYQGARYKGKEIGTATVFQQDVRISTNVRSPDKSRAIGTRVSEQVYERVLETGGSWFDRAFVVTEWYKTAYEPIKDVDGRVIGMLYVGTLERPFVDMARNILLLFLAAALVVALLAGIFAWGLSNAVSRPLMSLLDATKILSGGKLGYKVSTDTHTTEINALASSFNDMSVELDEREYRLKVANEKLELLNRTYLDLVGFVSHELKSVLGSAIVSAYSLRCGFNGAINSEQQKALDLITRNLDYLAGVVRKFLDLSRIEKGELKINRSDVDLKKVFDSALENFVEKAAAKQMEVISDIPPGLTADCDEDLILIVANNLIDNAVKYGLQGGDIVLSCKETADRLRVEIYNDSRSIRDDEKEKIFEKFSRLNRIESKTIKGAGLGLFITREIINRHGGDIWVEPHEKGNSFVFEIAKSKQDLSLV